MRVETCLDGEWQLVLDPDDTGRKNRWFDGKDLPEAVTVKVPSVWDLWVPDYDGVGWYFREFDLGPEWGGRVIHLEFEAADYFAEVWLNGEFLGSHEGGYTPFTLDAAGVAVIGGGNRLAVRIVDPHGADGYGDFKPKTIPCAKEHGYFTFAGLWGSVRLVGKPAVHLTDVFVRPDIRRKRVSVTATASGPADVRLSIEGTPFEAEGPCGTLSVEFPEHELWSPEQPTLYMLSCDLVRNGEVVDHLGVRFGMREFTVKDNRFHLNNHPVPVRGVLHQPDYARSLAAPESEELARRELDLAKAAGFNLLRLHVKTAPRITLDLADELGILLYEEPPIGWIKDSPFMKERCEREVREMVLRDRNHPSVVIWGMLNESGNAGCVVNGGAQLVKDDLCRLARSLDPSRLIIDDSGGVNTTRETARFMRPYHDAFEPFDDLHIYQRAPVDYEIEQYYRHSGDPDQLFFLSEFGFGGMEDLDDVIAHYGDDKEKLKDARFLKHMLDAARKGFQERGLDRVFGSFSGFTAAARELQCDAARHQIDALRSNSKLAGYCYTQLCDAGHEFCAGVLDRWRRPKPVFDTMRDAQQPLRPLIQLARTNLAPREEVAVTVSIANEERVDTRGDLSLQVVGPTNQVLWKKKRSIRVPRGTKEVWAGKISASGSPGTHKFVVRLMQGVKRLSEGSVELHVVQRPEPCDVEIHVVDPHDEWRKRCMTLAKQGTPEAPVHIVPPLANTVRAYPDDDLAHVLAQVRNGAVALVFSPPEDWNDFAVQVDEAIRATSKDAVGAFLGMYHYVKLHPVFEGLPAKGLMRQVYRGIVPPRTFLEATDEDICGTFDTTPIAGGNYMMDETAWWGNDILVRGFGAGRMVFTHLRVLENLGEDPVAGRLFVNMLRHFSRRSVPSEDAPPTAQKAADWLRREGTEGVRMWMVMGMFPNWGGSGHDTPHPPEDEVNLHAVYPGWYRPIQWRRWYSRARDRHLVNLQDATTPVYEYYPRFDHGTAYAYTELHADRRQGVTLTLGVQDATKVWLNGRLVFEDPNHRPHKVLEEMSVPAFLRQGRNTVLVKVSKVPGEFQFSLNFESDGEPLSLRSWK